MVLGGNGNTYIGDLLKNRVPLKWVNFGEKSVGYYLVLYHITINVCRYVNLSHT